MTLLPELTAEGLLPHDVDLTLDQILQCGFVSGDGMSMYKWDGPLRRRLATNLKTVVERLWEVGFSGEIGIDGSFVRACLRPHDIDVYCVLSDDEAVEYDERLERLNELEGEPIWAFGEDERVSAPGFLRPVSPLCGKYGVDLNFDFGQFSGMLGPNGERLTFREAFRFDQELRHMIGTVRKGIIRVVPSNDRRGESTARGDG